MKVARDFYVYVVIDSRGTAWVGLTDRTDTIMLVDGLQDAEGNEIDDEMNAVHIPGWCIRHDLRCIVTVRTIEIEIPAG